MISSLPGHDVPLDETRLAKTEAADISGALPSLVCEVRKDRGVAYSFDSFLYSTTWS